MKRVTVLISGALLLTVALYGAARASGPIVDGSRDAGYGSALSIQAVQTNFGDNNLGTVDNANGSELNEAYGFVQSGVLYLFLEGNLESNFNKLDIFLDTAPGGQGKLRGDNPNVDFNGLNRMGDDGSGNGLTFDPGFEADYWISVTGGGSPYAMYANYSEILTGGGGTGYYLGTSAAASGALSGGFNPNGIQATIDNRNVVGVGGGCSAATGAGAQATGVELAIPLTALGNATGCIKVVAFVNGGGHDYVSNQVLGPLPAGTCNLGEPRTVDFRQFPGDQFFTVCQQASKIHSGTWGSLRRTYR